MSCDRFSLEEKKHPDRLPLSRNRGSCATTTWTTKRLGGLSHFPELKPKLIWRHPTTTTTTTTTTLRDLRDVSDSLLRNYIKSKHTFFDVSCEGTTTRCIEAHAKRKFSKSQGSHSGHQIRPSKALLWCIHSNVLPLPSLTLQRNEHLNFSKKSKNNPGNTTWFVDHENSRVGGTEKKKKNIMCFW